MIQPTYAEWTLVPLLSPFQILASLGRACIFLRILMEYYVSER